MASFSTRIAEGVLSLDPSSMRPLQPAGSATKSLFVCQSCRLLLTRSKSVPRPRRCFSDLQKSAKQFRRKKNTADDGKPEIRWFDQTPADGSGKVRVEKAEDDQDTKSLKKRIDQLDEELQQMKNGGALAIPAVISRLLKNEGGLDEDTKSALDQLERLSKSLLSGKEIASDGSENIARSTVKITPPKEQRVYLNRLNGYLKQAEAIGFDTATNRQLWRWFVRCKQNIPRFAKSVSPETWNIMWESQASRPHSDPDRAAHLRSLAQGIMDRGLQLSPTQSLEYTEALFLDGKLDKAIEQWNVYSPSLGEDVKLSESFYVLGIKMFAAADDAETAHCLAFSLLNDEKINDPRVLIPVITVWTRKGGNIPLRRAWVAYLRMRELFAPEMTMADYDAVCKAFLDAGRADLGVGVFKDMMLAQDGPSDYDSFSLFRKASRTVKEIQSMASDTSQLNKLSWEAMTALPKRMHSKYFYGSWMKKLLGAGDIESAVLVAELMNARRLGPDAKYLNGVIAAWMRRGNADSFKKAEVMALKMIENRKGFAWQRRAAERGEVVASGSSQPPVVADNGSDPWTTSATLETFCILIDYYLGRQKHDQIRWLNRAVRLAEFEPNAFFMTRLLASQLATDGIRKIWQTYADWAHTGRGKPDFELYGLLWDCAMMRAKKTSSLQQPPPTASLAEPVALSEPGEDSTVHSHDRSIIRKQQGFPSPRALFSSMMTWFVGLSGKERERHREDFPRSIYDSVIRSLLQDGSGDLAGVIVALHCMKAHLGFYPTADTADDIVSYLAKKASEKEEELDRQEYLLDRDQHALGQQQASSAVPSRSGKKRNPFAVHEHTMLVMQRLQEIANARTMLFDKRAIDGKDVAENFKEEENLYLLSSLIRDVLVKNRDIGELDTVVQRAAWDMGVGGIDTGDHLHLD